MSFETPLVLIALVAIPLLAVGYRAEQQRRSAAAAAFVTTPLLASVAPRRPGARRHIPPLVLLLALVALIVAAAKPQHKVSVVVSGGAVMLADDVSASMASTDVAPSRLVAAERAATRFTRSVPASLRVGLIRFNATPILLQTPSTNHSLVISALTQLRVGGHTAIGSAVQSALKTLQGLRSPAGKRLPSAIVLISDGTSDTGADPESAASAARAAHIPIYTVAVGTAHGTIAVPSRGGGSRSVPVPLNPSELQAIGRISGGKAFTADDAGSLREVYSHLAAQLGHRRVEHQITSIFAGVGLVLLLIGGGLALRWFGRLV